MVWPTDKEPDDGMELDSRPDVAGNGSMETKKGRVSVVPKDAEQAEKKLKYPKVVFFIIGNEFCERFTYYGMRTILSIFLKNSLQLQESTATIIYHVFSMLCYFFPLVGAIIADSWLGKFKTIAYLSIVYAVGNIVVSIASAFTKDSGVPSAELTYLGLILIAVGTGGIKPCVSSFGGEQFTVPQQARQLASFFSVFYFSINAGSLISTFLTPELRTTQCLGQDTCYPIAFGVPAVLMIVAIVIFFVGKPGYKITKPKGNIIVDVSKCIGSALRNKMRSGEKKEHWLDHADAEYSKKLRDDTRSVLRVLLLFVPLPIFWALYDQQGSRWTFQANNMNGRIGSFVFKPDQMQVVNPILIMILLPLFDYAIYPLLAKMHIMRKPLQKMAVGGMLGAVAFIISGIVQNQLDPYLPVEPSSGLAQVRVFSTLPCDVTLSTGGATPVLPHMGFWERTDISAHGTASLNLDVKGDCVEGSVALEVTESQSVSFHLYKDDDNSKTLKFSGPYTDDLAKDAMPKARIMWHFADTSKKYQVKLLQDGATKYDESNTGAGVYQFKDLISGQYEVFVDGQKYSELFMDIGGAYNVVVDKTTSQVEGSILVVIPENTLSLFWQMPQYIVISVAEIMVSVTGLEFSFTQAPNSMKSVLSSAWLLTDAVGNVIIILIDAIKFFPNEADEIYLFAGLMVADMLLFIWLAYRYVPVPAPSSADEDDEDETQLQSLPSTPSTTAETEQVKDKY